MMLDRHLKNTQGQGEEIHAFIDQYWDEYKEDHRVIFHHARGVEFLINRFGEDARWIIEQHLKDDQYGTIFRGVPEDENDSMFKGYTDRFKEAKQFASKLLSEV